MVPASAQDLSGLIVPGTAGAPVPLEQFLTDSFTTVLLILHRGNSVYEWSAKSGALTDVLPCYSIAKSVIGVVAGALMERGDLDPERGVVTYVPELESGGYRGVTVRDLLDMRTGDD